jgi:hypothetical protein
VDDFQQGGKPGGGSQKNQLNLREGTQNLPLSDCQWRLTGLLPASPVRKGGVKGSYTKMATFLLQSWQTLRMPLCRRANPYGLCLRYLTGKTTPGIFVQ